MSAVEAGSADFGLWLYADDGDKRRPARDAAYSSAPEMTAEFSSDIKRQPRHANSERQHDHHHRRKDTL